MIWTRGQRGDKSCYLYEVIWENKKGNQTAKSWRKRLGNKQSLGNKMADGVWCYQMYSTADGKNNPNFKYTVRNSQLSTGVHSQLFISAQQRNLVIMVYGSLNTQSPPAVKRLIEC